MLHKLVAVEDELCDFFIQINRPHSTTVTVDRLLIRSGSPTHHVQRQSFC